MVRISTVFKSLSTLAFAGTLLAGCSGMNWSGDKTATAQTKPAMATPAKPATPATPAPKPVVATPATPATPAMPAQANAKKAIRIKAGASTPFTDKAGNVWEADRGNDGGDTIDRDASLAITGTNDPDIFRSERYGMAGYSIPVPNGKYKVNLYFAETYDGIAGPGDRVFSFQIQNNPEHKDFDIFKETGGADKVKVVSEDVTVTNGKIDIKFTANQQNPCINAIEIIPS